MRRTLTDHGRNRVAETLVVTGPQELVCLPEGQSQEERIPKAAARPAEEMVIVGRRC